MGAPLEVYPVKLASKAANLDSNDTILDSWSFSFDSKSATFFYKFVKSVFSVRLDVNASNATILLIVLSGGLLAAKVSYNFCMSNLGAASLTI